ncbi:MAG: four helix bundle protein [Bacteroidota bacterium]|nr:four helix bundle protein [Bacteroidota bacterium]
MTISKFEDIESWKLSKELNLELFRIFENSKMYSLKDQILRASISIMNNIAEGFERQTNKEFKQFLYIAKGSAAEVRSMLYLINDLNIVDGPTYDALNEKTIYISKLLSNFIKVL